MEKQKELSEQEKLARQVLLGEEITDSAAADIFEQAQPKMAISPSSQSRMELLPINRDSLPSKGLYYPDDVTINIRSASTQEIKHYSSMDDTDPFAVDKHVSTLIDACCKVIKKDNTLLSYKDLSEFDKLYVFFAIRDRTFLIHKRENNLTNKYECPECGHKNNITINNDVFGYYSIRKELQKYYSEKEKCFIISDEELGSDPLKIYVPTVGVTEKITDYIKRKEIEKQNGEGGYYDVNDLTILLYTTPDWRLFDAKDNYIRESLARIKDRWNETRYYVATEMTRRLQVGIKPTLAIQCENCGKEVSAPVRFQQWRTFFSDKNIISRFFEDSESSDSE